MNEVVVGLFILAVAGLIGYGKYSNIKAQKAFEAAQKVLKDQIADLEAKLAALKK